MNAAIGIFVGMSLRELARNQIHFRLRPLDGHAWLQPRDGVQMTAPALLFVRLLRDRPVKFRPPVQQTNRQRFEIGRHDTDDGVVASTELYRLPNDIRIAAKTLLPQAVAQDHDIILSLYLFFGGEDSPEQRLDVHHLEESVTDLRARNRSGSPLPEKRAENRIGRDLLEDMIARAIVRHIGRRHLAARAAPALSSPQTRMIDCGSW